MTKEDIRDGTYDAIIEDVTYHSDRNGRDYARVLFELDSGERFINNIFSTFSKKDVLAAKALSLMNVKKITSLCVHNKKSKNKTIGIIHIHNILESNIQ